MWARRPTKGWVLRQLEGIETVQATAIIKIGERLAEARYLFRYDRREGGFGGWVEKRLNMSRPAAYQCIKVFEKLGESVLSSRHFDGVAKEALIILAAPSTPEEVRDAVEQMPVGHKPEASGWLRKAARGRRGAGGKGAGTALEAPGCVGPTGGGQVACR